MAQSKDWLLGVLLTWTIITVVAPTITVYRAALQSNYPWALFGFSGVGLSLSFLVIVATACLAWSIIYLGHRGASNPFGPLLIGWQAFLFLTIVYAVMTSESEAAIHAESAGVTIKLSLIGPLIIGSFLLLSIIWYWRHRHQPSVAVTWPKKGKMLMGLTLALAPVIITLFILGDGAHTGYDSAGVMLVVMQCVIGAVAMSHQELADAPQTEAAG